MFVFYNIQQQEQALPAAELQQVEAQPPVEQEREQELLNKEINLWFNEYKKTEITHFFIHKDFENEEGIRSWRIEYENSLKYIIA